MFAGITWSACTQTGYSSYNSGDGTCYKHVATSVKAFEAEVKCLEEGARLVNTKSTAVHDAVKHLVRCVLGHRFKNDNSLMIPWDKLFSMCFKFINFYVFLFWAILGYFGPGPMTAVIFKFELL